MSEYREGCNKRKDELHTKSPEVDRDCLGGGPSKKNKPFRVIATPMKRKDKKWPWDRKAWCFGKYATREDAEKAIAQKRTDRFWSEHYAMHIEG